MKITIKDNAACGEIQIPPGDYMVALASDCSHLNLTGRGLTISVPAVRRSPKARMKIRSIQVSFYCGGGKTWSLVVTTPKQGEFIALIDLV